MYPLAGKSAKRNAAAENAKQKFEDSRKKRKIIKYKSKKTKRKKEPITQ